MKSLSYALRVRWLWLQKVKPLWPWSIFPIQVSEGVTYLFSMAVVSKVDDGLVLFWKDNWLLGKRIEEVAPRLFTLVPKGRVNKCTAETLLDHIWISDVQGAFSVGVITYFLDLWDTLFLVELQPRNPYVNYWRLSNIGVYSTKFAHDFLFQSAIYFGPWEHVWKSWALGRRIFFHVVSATQSLIVGQWTAWHDKASHIVISSPYVTKRMRPFNMSLSLVCSPGKFGFPSCPKWDLGLLRHNP